MIASSNNMHLIQLENRLKIIDITHMAKATHLGSSLSAVDIIEAIYQVKKTSEKFILSAGHAAIALYAVLENHGYFSKSSLRKLSTHPTRNVKVGIDLSSGSLGQGLPIAVGMALANKGKNVYCCISDGECAEGSIAEALRVGAENNLSNLKIIVNVNGYAAYRKINLLKLARQLEGLGWKAHWVNGHNLQALKKSLLLKNTQLTLIMAKTRVEQLPFLHGVGAHYYQMTEKDYQKAKEKWLKLLK